MKKVIAVLVSAAICASTAQAVSFNEKSRINQRIGGGSPVSESASLKIKGLAGTAWNADLSCGNMSLNAETLGTFSSGSFKQLQASLIGSLMSALNPLSLLGAAIQKSNPDLYDDLMNGSFMASDSFLSNLGNCQTMQGYVLNNMPAGSLKQLSVGEEYSSAIKKHADGNVQLSSLIMSDSAGSSYDDGSNGVTFGGEKRGSVDKPIDVIDYTSKAGFNTLADRDSDDTSTLSSSDASELGMAKYFKSPSQVNDFVEKVVGETHFYTDSSEEPRKEEKGIGAKAVYSEARDTAADSLNTLVDTDISSIDDSDLTSLSTSGVNVSRDLVLALKQIHPNERKSYINALASDIAISQTYEKLLNSVRIIDAGMRDSSVSNVAAVREEAMLKRDRLIQEMDLLERELRFNRELAGSSPMDIMQRANLESDRAISVKNPGANVNVSGAN